MPPLDPGWPEEYAFQRAERRRSRVKRGPLDCGCTIDAGEPYEYEVWKLNGETELGQLLSCEPCTVDYAGSGGWWRAS